MIQEMARPKLKFAVKVERLADAVIDLMMEYEKNERDADPDWQPSVQLSAERKLFYEDLVKTSRDLAVGKGKSILQLSEHSLRKIIRKALSNIK
jgi:hypothetical protein